MKLLKITGLLVCCLIVLQNLTYSYIGLKTLRGNLLSGSFANLVRNEQDSVFIRDYFLSDCKVGDHNIYLENNLSEITPALKIKLKTNHIYFDKSSSFMDTTSNKYKLAYFTYAYRVNPFEARQYESLVIYQKVIHHKDAIYLWLLFFWLKIKEQDYSEKLG